MLKTPEQEVAFNTKIAELKAQHPGSSLHLIDLEDLQAQVVMRSLTPEEWKHLNSLTDERQKDFHMEQYTQKCTLWVVEPEEASFSSLLQEYPGLINPLSKQLMEITGALVKAVAKKL